jgi:hypothetical protein
MKIDEASLPSGKVCGNSWIFGGLDAHDDLLLEAILKLGIKLVCF